VPEAGSPKVIVSDDLEALAEAASGLVLSYLAESLGERGRARVILAGGTTPRKTYSLIVSGIPARSLPPGAIEWFFGDERWVPPTDPESNERMARETLLGPISAPESTIRSWIPGRGDPVDCARRYGETLRAELRGEKPDILLLGIGPDGHTASLFPGATAYLPDGRRVPVACHLSSSFPAAAIRGGGAPPGWRLTLCPDFLRTSRHVVFLAAGADKAGPLRRAVDGDAGTPAAWIRGMTTHFIVTRDAAAHQEQL
jgi:6-phosphogluconolactonase